MKRKSFRKAAAFLLAVLLIACLSPISSFAAEFGISNLVIDPVVTPVTPVVTPVLAAPAAPSDLTGKLVHSSITTVTVQLDWTDNSNNESGFRIMKKGFSDASYQAVATVNSNVETCQYTYSRSLSAGDYKVCAYNSIGDSDFSNIVGVYYTIPVAVTDLTAQPKSGSAGVYASLKWTETVSKAVDYYEISKKETGGAYAVFATTSGVSFDDYSVEQGKTYFYKVDTVGYYGGATSGEASTTIPATIPNAPSNFAYSAASENGVKFSWTDNSNNEDEFVLEWTRDGSVLTPLSLGENLTMYSILSLPDGKYTAKIKASNSAGSSAYATQVLAFTVPLGDETTDSAIDFTTASDWATGEIQKAYDLNLTTDRVLKNFQKNITREEFCEIAVKLYEALSGKTAKAAIDNPFDDTTNAYVLKAFELGIVKGTSDTAFSPSNPITRQEICVMIYRTLKADDPTLGAGSSAAQFADQSQIANWAIDAVRFANENGIMKGIGGNKISPLNNTTREQAIVLLERTYESFE